MNDGFTRFAEQNSILTPEKRLAVTIGEIIVQNAKLAFEVETLKAIATAERMRADEAELKLHEKATE